MKPHIARLLLALLAFGAGFWLIAAAISWVVPPPRVKPMSAKVDGWAESREFDTILIGSSRMNRQVIPAVFDAAMAEAGHPTRSFNLSSDGMRPPEDSYVLDRALEERSRPLRLIVAEVNPIDLRVPENDLGTDRVVFWHDTARLRSLWARVWSHSGNKEPTLSRRLSDTWRNLRYFSPHAQYWVMNGVRSGIGADTLTDELGITPDDRDESDDLGPRNDGFNAADEDDQRMTARELRGFEKARRAMAAGRRLIYGDDASQAELARKARLARRHGARLVLIAPPAMNVEVIKPAPGIDALFLDFSDPKKFPELFRPELRRDAGHLNTEGSILYTKLLVRHLAEALE